MSIRTCLAMAMIAAFSSGPVFAQTGNSVEGVVIETRPEIGEIVVRQTIPGVGTIDRTFLLGERAESTASRLPPGARVRLRLDGSSGQVSVQQLTQLRATAGGAGIPTTTVGPIEHGRLVLGAGGPLQTMSSSVNQAGRSGSAATDARSSEPGRLREQAGTTGSVPSNGSAQIGAQGSTDARSPSSTNLRGQGGRGVAGAAGSARQSELTAGRRDSSSLRSGGFSGRSQPASLPSFDERRLVETDFQQSLSLMEEQLDELRRATGRFTTPERVAFQQRIDDLEARLRDANLRLNTLQGRTGRAWLEARAEFDALMAELAMQFQEIGSLFGGDLR